MNDSKLPKLHKAVRRVVLKAAEPGGAIDEGVFTMARARAEVTEMLGLEEGALDGGEWKKVVKKAVDEALVSLANDGGESSKSSVASASPPPRKKARRKATPTPTPESDDEPEAVIEVDDGSGAESEMSSVYDAPPKPKASRKRKSDSEQPVKKKRGETKGAARKTSMDKKPRAKKDPNEGLSKEEARVADLKRIIVACGVRKQWSKEFEGADTFYAQTVILKNILKGLGMEGKETLAKAKAIKEARELASELNDVKEFEAARGMSAKDRTRRNGTRGHSRHSDGDEPEEKGAADAVMSFLQNEDSD